MWHSPALAAAPRSVPLPPRDLPVTQGEGKAALKEKGRREG